MDRKSRASEREEVHINRSDGYKNRQEDEFEVLHGGTSRFYTADVVPGSNAVVSFSPKHEPAKRTSLPQPAVEHNYGPDQNFKVTKQFLRRRDRPFLARPMPLLASKVTQREIMFAVECGLSALRLHRHAAT